MRVGRIRVGTRTLKTITVRLGKKNLVLLVGRCGYIICGYLNMKAADAFGDVAVIVKGVACVRDVLRAKVYKASREARKRKIHTNQPIRDVIKIIA